MNKEKIIIFGISDFSRDLQIIIEKEGEVEVVAWTVHQQYITATTAYGLPIVPFEMIEELYSPTEYCILNPFGFPKMNVVREDIFHQINSKGYKNYTFISKNAIIYSDKIGEGCIIMPSAYIGPNVEIGCGNMIDAGTTLSHRITIGNFNYIAPRVTFAGVVLVENNCFVGVHATLSNGVKLASQTLIAAGACVIDSTEPGCAYKGMPAKKMNATSMDVIARVVNRIK